MFMRVLTQLPAILIVWALCTGLVVWWHPDALPVMGGGLPAVVAAEGEVTVAQARELESGGRVLWIDVRPAGEFERDRIPGAENIPSDQAGALESKFFVWSSSNRLTPDTVIIIYCASPTCGTSHQLRDKLRQLNDALDVRVLAGGWPEWRRQRGK
jgi:rhodanese-related sulfurtransferase